MADDGVQRVTACERQCEQRVHGERQVTACNKVTEKWQMTVCNG